MQIISYYKSSLHFEKGIACFNSLPLINIIFVFEISGYGKIGGYGGFGKFGGFGGYGKMGGFGGYGLGYGKSLYGGKSFHYWGDDDLSKLVLQKKSVYS